MAVIDGKWLSKEGLTYFWSKIKAIFTKQTETNTIANLGAKNLLDFTFSINGDTSARISNGVTFTINTDGSISTSGTASSNVTSAWIQMNYAVPDDPVILSGCPAGGANNKYRIDILDGSPTGSVVAADYGNGVAIKSSMFTNGTGLIRIRIEKGQNVDGLVFKPMIRPAEITDDTYAPYAPTNRELYETKTEQTETNVIANLGAKNLLTITNDIVGSKTTAHGRTFEILSDGGIKITGSPDTSYADFYLLGTWSNRTALMDLSDQNYLISLASSSSSSIEKLYVRALDRRTGSTASSATARAVPNQQTEFSFPVTTILITIEPSATISEDGIIVYPMIRPAKITDPSFQPYAPTNRELYETKSEQTETNVIANLGAKNLLHFDARSAASTEGVSFTVNSDGTITVNGTPQGTGPSYVQLMLRNDAVRVEEFCDGSHILSGCPSGGSDSSYRMYVAKGSYSRFDYGNGVLLTKTTLTDIRVVIYIANGYTANNLIFKPMIRPAAITDASFQPYAPTNRELYETRFASKFILPNNVDLNNIKTGGIYNGVNSTGNSAVHMPVATGSFNFVLTVIEANEFIIQIFKQLNSAGDPNFYVRRFYVYNSDWGSWYQFTGTQV